MIGFGVIGATMIGLLIRRLITTTHFLLNQSRMDYSSTIGGMINGANNETRDGIQLLLDTVMIQIGRVMSAEMTKRLDEAKKEAWVYVITLCSTLGVYFLGSFVQLDFGHMFTCFIQCKYWIS